MIVYYTDGSSLLEGSFIRGSGLGVIGYHPAFPDPVRLIEWPKTKDGLTNNQAEYLAVAKALLHYGAKGSWANEQGWTHLEIRSDSELVVKQLNGEYSVKDPTLKTFHKDITQWLNWIRFPEKKPIEVEGMWHPARVVIKHVRRENNKAADNLSKIASHLSLAL